MSEPEITLEDRTLIEDLLRRIAIHARAIWQASLALVLLVAVIALVYWATQPTQVIAYVGFRLTFANAEVDRYPNNLPFAVSDILNTSVLEEAMTANKVAEYCSPDIVRFALTVQETAAGLREIDESIAANLAASDAAGDVRQRTISELRNRRDTLQSTYQLRYIVPRECAGMPRQVVAKLLNDILEVWAKQSDERRGVLNVRVSTLNPVMFDRALASGEALFVRTDLVRANIRRVLDNILELEQRPGANLVRVGDDRVGLAEARARLEDLLSARLDPLQVQAGAANPDSVRWVNGALRAATAELQASERRVDELRRALLDYGAATAVSSAVGGDGPEKGAGTLTQVQMDRAFIDRLLELSETNTRFRQELTRGVIIASRQVVARLGEVAHYRGLLEAIQRGGGGDPAQMEARLRSIAEAAKADTRLVQDLYNEFSRISFRVSSEMYRIHQPAEFITTRAFAFNRYVMTVLVTALLAPFLVGMLVVFSHYLRGLARGTRRS